MTLTGSAKISLELEDLLSSGPIPQPTSDTQDFWDSTSRGELVMPYCGDCSRYFFYPRITCRYCHSEDVSWRIVSGNATLLSFVINYMPFPEFGNSGPQVIAVVRLTEGVNMMTQIAMADPSPEKLKLGMPLRVGFVKRRDIALPLFVPTNPLIEGPHD